MTHEQYDLLQEFNEFYWWWVLTEVNVELRELASDQQEFEFDPNS